MSWESDHRHFESQSMDEFQQWAGKAPEAATRSVATQTRSMADKAVELSSRVALQAACQHVFDEIGAHHRESVYQNALVVALGAVSGDTKLETESPVDILFRGTVVGTGRIDIEWGTVLVEIKVNESGGILHKDRGQLRKYLRARPGCTGLIAVFHSTGCVVESVSGYER